MAQLVFCSLQKQKIHVEQQLQEAAQLSDKEQLRLEEQQQQLSGGAAGLLARSLQEDGDERLFAIKQLAAAPPAPQPMADDDSDMADDITREKFPGDSDAFESEWALK